MSGLTDNLLPRAQYGDTIARFLGTGESAILGTLLGRSEFAVEPPQKRAWVVQIDILKRTCRGLSGYLMLEFHIPRMGKRVDAVLVAGGLVFVLEFKVGEKEYKAADVEQVWDYALDLKNFHETSHHVPMLPILVATEAPNSDAMLPDVHRDRLWHPMKTNGRKLKDVVQLGLDAAGEAQLDPELWLSGAYHPTPTIIEAARHLYAYHSVDAISRSDAGARNLQVTSERIEDIVDRASRNSEKVLCIVTGVPGAGKTLVGLNVATRRSDPKSETHAVYLSGNGPLVKVLREALARDEVESKAKAGKKITKTKAREAVKAFIQNVHHFRDEALRDANAPIDRVVIFDEAQRAWDEAQTSRFMKEKKKTADFNMAEADFLLSYLDRHDDWAVVVCLVGGGQEINTGEAGIGAWLDAVRTRFRHWCVYVSPNLNASEYDVGDRIGAMQDSAILQLDGKLHLATSMRSFRAEDVSEFVRTALDCDAQNARLVFEKLSANYPIRLTRRIEVARRWLRTQARGSERYGLVASSKAQRLKPHAVDVRFKVDPVHWFLNGRDDTRSSYYLEDAATEYQIQGLELDWVGVTWDGDFRYAGGGWSYHAFVGDKWQNTHKERRRRYLLNSYRVLLTRARQGMVIFVPEGSSTDSTRRAEFYDPTFEYLNGLGIPTLEQQ